MSRQAIISLFTRIRNSCRSLCFISDIFKFIPLLTQGFAFHVIHQ